VTLQGKTAVVTGAAGAIGAAVSRDLARAGMTVLLIDMANEATGVLAAEVGGHAVHLDLSDAEAIAETTRRILGQFGRVDVPVNNAGVLNNAKMASTTLDDWRKVQGINVDAAFLLSQAFLPGMRAARWGRIINMSSSAAKTGGLTAGTDYSVSKTALLGLTFAAAREVAGEGVTVNAIAAAYVISPMVSEQLTPDQRAAQLAAIPVGRFCEPEEVAHAVMSLASPLAGFITGEVIDMNGGLHFD
jgi:3-oxoacyl-[acyl-carrier protein] reductase